MKYLSLITFHSSLITLLTAMTACSSDDDGQTDSNDSANRTYTGTKKAVLAEGEFSTTTIKVK